ncbi:uncharacterized protein [Ptychodera flava]|uniref:uncharacterized protein n=1 Tax=Ptychodera flava TaxID=63121 RepID=UPI003969D5C0
MPVPVVVESSSVDTACDAQQSSCRCDEPASPLNAADHRSDDDDFIPSDSESNTTVSSVSSVLTDDSTPSVHDDQKYIIFWSCLLSLIRLIHCPRCGEANMRQSRTLKGTMLLLVLKCTACQHKTGWNSQPYVGNIPAGNILLSSAILTSGALVSKVLRIFSHMRVAAITARTFFRHQSQLLLPSIRHVWAEQRTWLLASLQADQRDLVLGGDGRSDSPGHSAKFGSYTVIELVANVIIDMQLVQSNEVGGAVRMEKEGLIRSLADLEGEGLTIGTIVTDRHVQIRKWLRENMPNVEHLFDVWHIAKGLKKKLLAIANERECRELQPWIPSIINHLYWCAVSTPPGEPATVLAKWVSVLNHMVNVHTHNDALFPSCLHGRLQGREARKQWLQPCSVTMVKLERLLTSTALLRDIRQMSGQEQTSS